MMTKKLPFDLTYAPDEPKLCHFKSLCNRQANDDCFYLSAGVGMNDDSNASNYAAVSCSCYNDSSAGFSSYRSSDDFHYNRHSNTQISRACLSHLNHHQS